MIFYCHDQHQKEDAFSWHRQKGQALSSARDHVKTVPRGEFIEVEKVTLVDLPTKDLVLALLNGSGYVSERKTIAEIKGRLKPKQTKKKVKKANPKSEKEKEEPAPLRW